MTTPDEARRVVESYLGAWTKTGLAFLVLVLPLACTTASPDDAVCIASGGLCVPSANTGANKGECMSSLNTAGCASSYICCIPTGGPAFDAGLPASEGGKDGTVLDGAKATDGANVRDGADGASAADGSSKGDGAPKG